MPLTYFVVDMNLVLWGCQTWHYCVRFESGAASFGLLCRSLDRVVIERKWETWIQPVGRRRPAKGICSAGGKGGVGVVGISFVPLGGLSAPS